MYFKNLNELEKYLCETWGDASDVAELAVNNQFTGCFDGVVFLDLENGELYGAMMSQGTIKNPEEPAIEIYRLSERFDPSEVCTDCVGCTLLDGETEEDVFNNCLIETVAEDFQQSFTRIYICELLEEALKWIKE